jgi:hypothetical protein
MEVCTIFTYGSAASSGLISGLESRLGPLT